MVFSRNTDSIFLWILCYYGHFYHRTTDNSIVMLFNSVVWQLFSYTYTCHEHYDGTCTPAMNTMMVHVHLPWTLWCYMYTCHEHYDGTCRPSMQTGMGTCTPVMNTMMVHVHLPWTLWWYMYTFHANWDGYTNAQTTSLDIMIITFP